MAVWLLRRAGIVLTLFFRISYCEYDLLENLKPKRNDPPELTDFLKSVLYKKDDFKKIREVAKHLRLHASPIDEDVFLNDQDETRTKTRLMNLKHLNRKFNRPIYRTSNINHPLSRRSGILDRPINDVYPYMYDENMNEAETDERKERSSWKDVKEKKHKHHNNQRDRKRYRRGLDLTDYSSDNDLQRGNIKIFPRSRTGYRIVPGNRYQQRRDISTNRNTKRKRLFLQESKEKSVSELFGSSPSTERAIPNDFSAEHDILGFKAESLSESDISQRNKKNNNDNIGAEENDVQEIKTNLDPNKLLYNRHFNGRIKTQTAGTDRKKRSMKLNIIDDNNLITSIRQDNTAKSVILTLRNDKHAQTNEHLPRKTVSTPTPDFESLHKALHSGQTKMHENPSNAVDIPKAQEVQPDIFIELNKPNEKQDYVDNQDIIKQSEANGMPLIYQLDEDINIDQDEHSTDQKQNMLQDLDEPTSALEQYELSTKPYVPGVPRSENILSSLDLIKKVTDFLDPADATKNKGNQFNVKENKDMVHGNNRKSLLFIERRSVNEKVPMLEKHRNDYKEAINSRQGKLDIVSPAVDYHSLKMNNQLKPKRDSKSSESERNLEYIHNNDYYDQDQHENSFQSRKLQSFYENESNEKELENQENSQGTPYGYLDYENGRNNHIKEPGFTKNKIRVKRDLTDLFGMNNDEEYSEDLLDDYNPSVKQERSDYTYEEEGDSAVPEKQVYVKKKKHKDKLSEQYQNTENKKDNSAISTRSITITSERPTTCGSSNQTSKIQKENLNKRDFNKENGNFNSGLQESNHNNKIKVRRDVQCTSTKDVEKPNKKSKNNCDNCKTNGSENDENCKDCNKNGPKEPGAIPHADKIVHTVTDSEILSNANSNEHNAWNYLESSNIKNMKIRSHNQTGSDISGCNTNTTFHHKNTTNTTSSEENKKPPKEEANAEQEYKFNHSKNQSDPCGSMDQTSSNISYNSIIMPNFKEYNEDPLQEHPDKKNVHSEAEPQENMPDETDSGETAEYAHHPLKSKTPHTLNDNKSNEQDTDSKGNIDDVLTHFHTKHNENEFSKLNQKPAREELPDVETSADRNDEENFEELFRDNHNEQKYENRNNIINRDIKDKMVSRKLSSDVNENDNEQEFSLIADSFKNNEINDNKKEVNGLIENQFRNKEDVHSLSQNHAFKRNINEINLKKNRDNNEEQNVAKSSVSTNRDRNLKEMKPLNLLNSVENFANIIEDEGNKKINKRNTQLGNSINKQDNGYFHNIDINGYRNDAPFEKFSKLNSGYWKKPLKRIIRKLSAPYVYQNHFYNTEKTFPNTISFKQDYANKNLHYINTNRLRRIRRDQFSKVPERKIENRNFQDNLRRQKIVHSKLPNLIERKIRTKGQCNDIHEKHDKHKGGMKEWLNPQRPNSNQRPCLLGQDAGLNPSFGLKPTKGSCNDEAELERGSKDYSQLHDALNGHLASLVVQTTFQKVKEHPQLKSRFSHGLTRQHGFKNEMKDLNAFRNNETEGDIKHTEEMLHQIMTVLNKIILDQVRRRTCKHLPPELQKYLASITKLKKKPVDEETKISEEGIPLPLVKEGKSKDRPIDTEQGDFLFSNPGNKADLETDEEEVKKKMRMIKELLNKYKHMSSECKIKVEPIEDYLKKHLCLLKNILKEIKRQKAKSCKNDQFNSPNKLKRKNYEVPLDFNVKQPDVLDYNKYTKTDLINKQLNSIGLGPSRTYKPTFNLNQLIEDAKYKMKYKSLHENKPALAKNHGTNTKANFRNDGGTMDQLQEDYENPKNEHKREISGEENNNRQLLVSEKYKKLAEAAESLRKKRAIEERLGKLFGKIGKRSVRNENYQTIKSLNKQYRDSRIGFETPVMFSLKK